MSATSELIVAGVTVLGALGATGKFIWNKLEARFDTIEQALEECRLREVSGQERRGALLTVIELLWQEVQHHLPESPVLTRAKKLLDDLKILARDD